VLIATILWIDLGWNAYQEIWNKPLGPGLSLPNPSISQPGNQTNDASSDPSSEGIPSNAYIFPNTAIPSKIEGAPLCGGPTTMTLLAIGSDTRGQSYLYGLSDVIRYVRIDFVSPHIDVLEFPRDLWVEIPDIEDHYGITHGKLNQAYLYGNPGMGYYQGPGEGPELLARTLDLNFGARPDHYVAANMYTFVRLVNAVGGINIDLPYSVDARKPDQQNRKDLYFAPGPHHLNGEQALMLARIREVSVFGRADQQNRILCALRNEIVTPRVLPKIPEIIASFEGTFQTDLNPQQIARFACLLPMLKPSDITFTTFPRELLKESRTFDVGVNKDVFIFTANYDTLRLFVDAFEMGVWPEKKSSDSPTQSTRTRGEGEFSCP
jgi:LCP family protein required for cell wall assembly